ncbi:hypothetical protein KCU61_g185, partial [Aureobasidium melanogenum]
MFSDFMVVSVTLYGWHTDLRLADHGQHSSILNWEVSHLHEWYEKVRQKYNGGISLLRSMILLLLLLLLSGGTHVLAESHVRDLKVCDGADSNVEDGEEEDTDNTTHKDSCSSKTIAGADNVGVEVTLQGIDWAEWRRGRCRSPGLRGASSGWGSEHGWCRILRRGRYTLGIQ